MEKYLLLVLEVQEHVNVVLDSMTNGEYVFPVVQDTTVREIPRQLTSILVP